MLQSLELQLDPYVIVIPIWQPEQLREEEKASGIEVTPTELDMLLEEILEKENAAKAEIESGDTKKRKAEQDKASADSIRRLAMERMS